MEDGDSSTDHLCNFAAGPLDEFHLVYIHACNSQDINIRTFIFWYDRGNYCMYKMINWQEYKPMHLAAMMLTTPLSKYSQVSGFAFQNVNPVSIRRRHVKYTAVAAYFGCHSSIHARKFTKIGELRENMMPIQDLNYLQNILIVCWNIGFNKRCRAFIRLRRPHLCEPKWVATGSWSLVYMYSQDT